VLPAIQCLEFAVLNQPGGGSRVTFQRRIEDHVAPEPAVDRVEDVFEKLPVDIDVNLADRLGGVDVIGLGLALATGREGNEQRAKTHQ